MKPTFIQAKTLPEAWFQCIYQLRRMEIGDGCRTYLVERGSYEKEQQRLEFDFVVIRIEYPGSRPLVPDTPAGIPPPVTQEYLDGYLPYLMTSHRNVNEQYTYGIDIEKQMGEVIKIYREDGHNTNQAFMAVGNAESIFLRDPQCLRGIDTRVSDGKLHFVVYFRSWDLWGGFPANLGGIQILKEYMASEIGVEDGELIASSKGLHLYESIWPVAAMLVGV